MARSKEFDRESALRKAVSAFRENGFEGTSIQSLVDRMGIHRASLYDTYGNKEQLFREALESYEQMAREAYAAILESPAPARGVIERVFDRALADAVAPGRDDAVCLMMKTALSKARDLERVREHIGGYYDWFGTHFLRLVARAREEGSVRSPTSDRELAELLRQTLLGVLAAAAVDCDSERIARNVRQVLRLLDA